MISDNPENLRKPLNKIIFGIDKNLNTNDLKIYKFEIYPKTKNYPSENIELFLKNYNLGDSVKVNNFFDLKKFFNEIFKEINKVWSFFLDLLFYYILSRLLNQIL